MGMVYNFFMPEKFSLYIEYRLNAKQRSAWHSGIEVKAF